MKKKEEVKEIKPENYLVTKGELVTMVNLFQNIQSPHIRYNLNALDNAKAALQFNAKVAQEGLNILGKILEIPEEKKEC